MRARPRQQSAGASLLAGVLVFIHVGFHQVGHLAGVHLATLAVTHLGGGKEHGEGQTDTPDLCEKQTLWII